MIGRGDSLPSPVDSNALIAGDAANKLERLAKPGAEASQAKRPSSGTQWELAPPRITILSTVSAADQWWVCDAAADPPGISS